MRKLRASVQAQEDLLEIWEYHARQDIETANRLLELLREKFELLLEHPLIGRERYDLLIGLRSFPMKKYVVFYQPLPDGIEIMRVRHGASNLTGLFDWP